MRPWLTACVLALGGTLTLAADGAEQAIRCSVLMRNVALHLSDDIRLDVASLHGELVSRRPGKPPTFDDSQSYTLRLKSAALSVDERNLTALVNRAMRDSKSVKNLTLRIEGDRLIQKGTARKGISFPFTMASTVDTTPDGRLRLHATSIKAAGIPLTKTLDLFGIELKSLIKMPANRGLSTNEYDILMAPAQGLPPPSTEGVLADAHLSGNRLVMTMRGGAAPKPLPATLPDTGAKNFVYFYGGTVVFGKLTMVDADLQLVDPDPKDPFDFSPAHYRAQLVAGYSKNTERGGLRVMMPDYDDVARGQKLALPKVD